MRPCIFATSSLFNVIKATYRLMSMTHVIMISIYKIYLYIITKLFLFSYQCISGQNHKAEPYIFITFVVVLVILSAFIRWLYKNREHQLRMLATDFQLELQLLRDNGELEEEQMQSCNFTVPREIPRVMIEMHEVIGSGEFGDVMRGFLDEYKVTGIPAFSVAIKTVKDASSDTAIHEFNREAAVSALVSGHPNLVRYVLTVVTTYAFKL